MKYGICAVAAAFALLLGSCAGSSIPDEYQDIQGGTTAAPLPVSHQEVPADTVLPPSTAFVLESYQVACGMTMQEVALQLGEGVVSHRNTVAGKPLLVEYLGLDVWYLDGKVCAMRLPAGSRWRISGIGLGSTQEDVAQAYPLNEETANPNGVCIFFFRIDRGVALPITWAEFEKAEDPDNSYYLSINISQSGVVYDVVLRNRLFMTGVPGINATSEDSDLLSRIHYAPKTGILSISPSPGTSAQGVEIQVTGCLLEHPYSMKITWQNTAWESNGKLLYQSTVDLGAVDYIQIVEQPKAQPGNIQTVYLLRDGTLARQLPVNKGAML